MAVITWTWHGWDDEELTDPQAACYVAIYSDGNILPRFGSVDERRWWRSGAASGRTVPVTAESMDWRRNDGQLTDQPNQIDYVEISYEIEDGLQPLYMRLAVHPWADLDTIKQRGMD